MKKGYLLMILIVVISCLIVGGKMLYQNIQDYRLVPHSIEKYHFTISYPDHFTEFKTNENAIVDPDSQIKVTVSGESINEAFTSENMTENVFNLKSDKMKLRMVVDAINIEKATLDMEEICKRYAIMFHIYNEELVILEKENEVITINGNEVGKVVLTIKGKTDNSKVIAYLFSLDDKEITVTFITPEKNAPKAEKIIQKIIENIEV